MCKRLALIAALVAMGLPLGATADGTNTTTNRQKGPSSRLTGLTISEIMYHPPARSDEKDGEFVELFNTEPVDADIGGYRLAGDMSYVFPTGMVLKARSYLVVAKDTNAYLSISNKIGPSVGSLNNNGGVVRLKNPSDAVLLEAEYSSGYPWPASAAGAGHSLTLAKPDYGEGDIRAWSASSMKGGSPGSSDSYAVGPYDGLVINELVAHTDLPLEDSIELFNSSSKSINLSGCWLSDDPDTDKYRIANGTTLGPRAFITFTQTNFVFGLSMAGGSVYLVSSSDDRTIDAVKYSAQSNGASLGRYPDGAAGFQTLVSRTLGGSNAPPEVRDIVINEIMYHPISGNEDDEYVELYNRGTRAVDVGYWKFVAGIDYIIPPDTMIPASNYLVVAKNVTNLLAKYTQLNATNTVGDFSGTLSGNGERVVLAKPDDMALPFQDYVTQDEVDYSSGWGDWTDGGGSSLELKDPRSDNRLGMNWAGSDESQKAPWTIIDYTDAVDNGVGSPNPLEIWAVQDGEFIVDDLLMTTGATTNFYDNFEGGSAGWTFSGSLIRSSVDAGVGYSNTKGLYVRSSDRGEFYGSTDWFVNHIDKTMLSGPAGGQISRIRAKVRWVRGFPFLIIGTSGSWIATPGDVAVPANLGSPGLKNTAYTSNAGPAIDDIAQNPILPAASSNVVVTCRVSDVDGVASVILKYRLDGNSSTNPVAMNDSGTNGDDVASDGVYSAALPGQAGGAIVCFVIDAVDGAASPSSSRYPSRAVPRRTPYECYICWGMPQPKGANGLPTYRAIITSANNSTLDGSQRSREPASCTCVYEDYRVIHGGDLKNHAGNGRHGFWFLLPGSDRLLGDDQFHIHESSSVEQFGVSTRITGSIGEIGGIVRAAPFARNAGGLSLTFEYVVPARDLCTAWFGDPDPEVFKGEDWQIKNDAFGVYTSAFDGAMKKVTYASIDAKRAGGKTPNDDYSQVYKLATTFAAADNSKYVARVKAVVDIRSWAAHFAVAGLTGDVDHYGTWPGAIAIHNYYAYIPRNGRSRLMLHDFDFVFSTGPMLNGPSDCPIPVRMFNGTPTFRRTYFAVLKDAAAGPLRPELINKWYDDWNAAYASNGLPSGRNISADKTYLGNSRTNILTSLAGMECPLTISTRGGSDFSTNVNPVVLAGGAPVYAEKICINGSPYYVEYTSLTNWQAKVWLETNANPLTVTAYDHAGKLVGTDSITITYTGPAITPDGKLVINEIMYNAAQPYASFVELRNNSTNTLSLGGLRIDGIDCDIGYGYMVGPTGYVVVAANIPGYQFAYSNAEVVVGEYSGSLDNGGETLRLLRPDVTGGTTNWVEVDRVMYDDDAPWPVAADGTGPSLQLRDASNDNARVSNWAASTNVPYTPGMPNSVATNLAAFDSVWINEIMPTNTLFPDNKGEYEPWAELYNAGTNNVALESGNYYLSDSFTDLTKWKFPVGVTITNKAYLRVWCDGETSETTNGHPHAGFAMNSASGSVALVRVSGGQTSIVDYVNYRGLGTNQSYGSSPDGDPFSRQVFHYPTPGTTNNPTSDMPAVFINEWMADNTKTADVELKKHDWFELYNASNSPVDLTGFQISVSSNGTNRCILPAGASIPGKGFLLAWANGDHTVKMDGGALYVNFGLSKSGDTIWLFTPDGRVVDKVVFGPQQQDISEGRWPDGTTNVYPMPISTPGSANKLSEDKITLIKSSPGSVLFAPSTAKFIAAIDDAQVVGSVNRVEIWEGTNRLLAVDNPVAPCEYDWQADTIGTYQFWARMVDAGGAGTNDSQPFTASVMALANVGASNVTDIAADLHGGLIGSGSAAAYICWSQTDQGTNRWMWDNMISVGSISPAPFTVHVTGLSPGTWYYRCFAKAGVNEGWAPATSSFRTPAYTSWDRHVAVQVAGYTNGETLVDFPLLVALGTNVSGFTYESFGTNWYSLRFTDDQGRRLPHEVQSWNTNGTSYMWVRVLEMTNNARLHAWWGNAAATDAPFYTQDGSLWAPGYDGVWHLEPGLEDSSGRSQAAGDYGSTGVAGVVLQGRRFAGTNAYVDPRVGSSWYGANSNHLTVSFWVKPETGALAAKGATPFGSEALGYDTSGAIPSNRCLYVQMNTILSSRKWVMTVHETEEDLGSYVLNQWQLLTLVMSNGTAYGSVNAGPRVAVGSYPDLMLGAAPTLGKRNGGSFPFQGAIDEFRLARVARSAAWTRAEYNTITQASFVQYGNVGPAGAADTDGDGLPDGWVNFFFPLGGTNAAPDADPDEDGMVNADEYIAGTDPNNFESVFALDLTRAGDQMFVQFESWKAEEVWYTNRFRYYDLLSASNLVPALWWIIPGYSNLPGANAVVTYTNVPGTGTAPRFFKGGVRLE